jgi:hypothetical protein
MLAFFAGLGGFMIGFVSIVAAGVHPALRSNRSFDSDTHRQGAARRAGELTPRGALPVRAGQLRRYAAD